MRLATMLLIFSAGLAGSAAAAQAPESPAPAAPLSSDARRDTTPEAVNPPAGRPIDHGPPTPAGQPSASGMTLAELEEMALQCNPTLAQAAARVDAARGRYVQVGLCPNPVVGYSGEDIGDEGTAGQQGMCVLQQVVTGGKLRLDRAVAAQEVQQAEQAWEAQRWRVMNDVRIGSYEVLAAQRTVALDEQLLKISELGVRAADYAVKSKETSRVDLLQARVEANSARHRLTATAAIEALDAAHTAPRCTRRHSAPDARRRFQ